MLLMSSIYNLSPGGEERVAAFGVNAACNVGCRPASGSCLRDRTLSRGPWLAAVPDCPARDPEMLQDPFQGSPYVLLSSPVSKRGGATP